MERARARTPGASAHGTGPSRAQSTLIVEGSSWKERIPFATRAGQVLGGDQAGRRGSGATTSATTARAAATRSPPTSRTPVARPPSTSMPATSASHRITPPSDSRRRARARASSPAPPSGTGKPDGLADHRQQQPHQPGAGRVQRDVGVRGVPGEQQPRRRHRRTGCGRARRPGVSRVLTKREPADAGQRGEQPEPGPDRREGGEQPADEVRTDPVPLGAQLQPGVAVPGVLGVHQGGGDRRGRGAAAPTRRPASGGPARPARARQTSPCCSSPKARRNGEAAESG